MIDLAWFQAFGPAIGMVVALFVLQARGHLVPKRLHDQVRLDRDTALKAAETALHAATQASNSVESLTRTVAILTGNSEEQLALQRRTLDILSQSTTPPPIDRSAL